MLLIFFFFFLSELLVWFCLARQCKRMGYIWGELEIRKQWDDSCCDGEESGAREKLKEQQVGKDESGIDVGGHCKTVNVLREKQRRQR